MDKDITSSAFLQTKKQDINFYGTFLKEIKNDVDFDLGEFYRKEKNKNELICSVSSLNKKEKEILKNKNKTGSIKIQIKIKNASAFYFLLLRKTPFSKNEKALINKAAKSYSSKIEEFELAKIFQNQLSILQDAIMEKNLTTKELKEKNEKLIQTEKIRTEFLANVSHELRTPLNAIIGFSTALKDEMPGKLNEKQKSYANKILSSAIHLTGLINDILDMTKIEAGATTLNLKKVSPVFAINEVINTLEPLLSEKSLVIKKNFKFQGEILLDYTKFMQIIYNILGNAIKFSHPNSEIIISTQKQKDKILIKIKDFGVGIAKKYQKKIFDKFFQLENIYSKNYLSGGLGLTITSEFVRLLGGKIKLKSEIGVGSEFILEFLER